MEYLINCLSQSGYFLGLFISLILGAVLVNVLFFKFLLRLSKLRNYRLGEIFAKHCSKPSGWFLIVIALNFFVNSTGIHEDFEQVIKQLVALALIGVVSWIIIRLSYVLEDYIIERFDVGEKDNLKARKVHTQLRVTKRIVIVLVCIIAVGTMLMTFEKVRQLGTTILASAGIIGIIIGMAAQRTIGTFIAGLQIAFTQPIRIDDVVIVENEWGRIEEITLTYVVVKIWDLRRLIVPITYFIEKPFQNWTRISADLLVTVYIYVDYSVPVDIIRQQLKTILESSEYWDKKVCVLQTTNATDRAVELRALMSATDASIAWNLRCEVREKLLEFIQKNYSDALPKFRVELDKLSIDKKTTGH